MTTRLKPENPFLIYGYYSPEYFCDREKETSMAIDAFKNGRNLTMIAPRKMGKTGLIRHIFHQFSEKESDVITFYMDIYPTSNLGDFIRLFAGTVLGKLDSVPQRAFDRVVKFIRSCRPVFTFDSLTGEPKVTLDILPSSEEVTLKEIFDYLQSSEKRCFIAIDEFQQITEYPEKNVEALLRSYIQFLPNVNFIFSGSRKHVMQEMFISAKRPFYQSTQIMMLDSIDRDTYSDFASLFFTKKGKTLEKDVFNAIYDRFDGHTWYIQAVLNRIYGYSGETGMQAVDYAVNEIVEESTYAYENLMAAYPAGSIRLLKAIASEGKVKEITSGDFISKYKLRAASSVSSAVKKLYDNELIYKTSDGYVIYDRFFSEWLRRQM